MISTVAATGLLLAIVAYLLSQLGFRGVRAFTALSITAILLLVASSVGKSFGELGVLFEGSEMEEAIKTALKITLVGYVFGFASDTAAELGEGGISSAIILGGRIEMILVALPYIKDVINTALELVT
jgi:hypothetical protein